MEKVYQGFITESHYGENEEALFIGDTEEPAAKIFEEELQGRYVTVTYYISNKRKSKEELILNTVRMIAGAVDADYHDRYSELTGYLWTDEDLNVGSHDLLAIIRSNLGKFIRLEVTVHPGKKD